MRVLSIVGARPQFIKAAMLSRALVEAGIDEVLIHTGQHYDDNMSRIIFEDLGIRDPDHNLGVGSGARAYQIGETMKRLDPLCLEHSPDVMVVYGDTNSTLGGALIGRKLSIPVAHVEAGLRSFDRSMPEEVNRVLTDRVSTLLFCPTETAVKNLADEGIEEGVHNTGDVMYDAALYFGAIAREKSTILGDLALAEKSFVLATIHRDFNTDNREKLEGIVGGLIAAGERVVFPSHPRVKKQLKAFALLDRVLESDNVQLVDPVGYLDMLRLEMSARKIVTDSGGVQKEALFYRTPCITVRPSTEWVETVESGWNRLVDADEASIAENIACATTSDSVVTHYGEGNASGHIARSLTRGRS